MLVVNATEPEEAGRVLIFSIIGIWPGRSTGFYIFLTKNGDPGGNAE